LTKKFFFYSSYFSKASRRIGKSIAPIKLTKIYTSRLTAIAKLTTFFCSVRRGVGYNGRFGSIYKLAKKPRRALFEIKFYDY
jgi:hypothetical protein